MDSSRRRLALVAIVCFAIGLTGFAVAAHISGTVQVSDGVSLQAPDGINATLTGTTDANLESPFPTSGTVEWTTEAGNISLYSSGSAAATVAKSEINGTWTNVTAIDADPNSITVTPEDKPAFVVGENIDNVSIRDTFGVDDTTADFVYGGASGQSRVTIDGVPASTYIGAVDKNTGTLLDSAKSDSSGQITFNGLTNSEHVVVLETGVAPTVSNPSPTGELSNPPSELSVDITDGDFSGDTVTVEISLDGSVVGTQTTSSNGTVSQSISNPNGGSHDWSVDVSDEYGNTVNKSYSFKLPANLALREERSPHSKIDSATVKATFYEDSTNDPFIINKTTTNGKINLSGLPTGSEFSISVSAPGYHNRTVILESLYDQSEVFLINKTNVSTVENRFTLSDATGQFPPSSTEIVIQRAINESIYNGTGGYSWMAVSGDDLGADEAYVDDLIEEERYSVKVQNEDGDTRILGAYTPETTGTVDLKIGSVVIDPKAPNTLGFNASWYNASGSSPNVQVQYNDSEKNTSKLYVEIYEYGNKSNHLLQNTSYTNGPYGSFSLTQTVPAGENGTTWTVKFVAVREDSENVVWKVPVGPGAPTLTDMPAYLVTLLFVGTIWMVAGLFSQLNGGVGAIVVAGLGGIFFFLNLVPAYLGGGVVALSLLAGAILFLRDRKAGGL